MTAKKTSKAASPQPRAGRSRNRPRPTPKWLQEQEDLDEVARRRTLLVLSVLSGETPVTEAIKAAGISRGMYYELELRALNAMVRALTPGASPEEVTSAGAVKRAQELEQRLAKLEQEKRRAERMLYVTRKLVKPGSVKAAPGAPRGPRKRSTKLGTAASANSKSPTASSTVAPKGSSKTKSCGPSSIPTPAGAGGSRRGTES